MNDAAGGHWPPAVIPGGPDDRMVIATSGRVQFQFRELSPGKPNMQERIQKILAQAGYGSRRSCEEFITAGRVRVNGQVAQLGQKADPATDKITLDGRA